MGLVIVLCCTVSCHCCAIARQGTCVMCMEVPAQESVAAFVSDLCSIDKPSGCNGEQRDESECKKTSMNHNVTYVIDMLSHKAEREDLQEQHSSY
eukprot:5637663-Amphidinium_carterae.1